MSSPAASVGEHELTDEALYLMKSKLPQYVVNCFISAGFDTLKVISHMDVSNNAGNSIEEIEEYIRNEHPDWLSNGRFSPGHRLRIQVFVHEVQKSFTPPVTLGKHKRVTGCSDIKGERPKNDPRQNDNQASVCANVRRQIAKWQRHQTRELRDIKEQKHFVVRVNLGDGNECIPVVVCLLRDHTCALGNKNGSILISNWTRHVVKCFKQVRVERNNKISRFMVPINTSYSLHSSSPSPQSPSLRSPSPQSSSPQSFALSRASSPSDQLLPRFSSTPQRSLHPSPTANFQLSGSVNYMQPPTCMSISNPYFFEPFRSQSPSTNQPPAQFDAGYFMPPLFPAVLNTQLNPTPPTLSSNQSVFASVSMQQRPFYFPTSPHVVSSQAPCLSLPPHPTTMTSENPSPQLNVNKPAIS